MTKTGVVAAPEKLEIVRNGAEVSLTIACADIYAAMEFYDLIVAAAKQGFVRLTVMTNDPESLEEE